MWEKKKYCKNTEWGDQQQFQSTGKKKEERKKKEKKKLLVSQSEETGTDSFIQDSWF